MICIFLHELENIDMEIGSLTFDARSCTLRFVIVWRRQDSTITEMQAKQKEDGKTICYIKASTGIVE